MSSATPLKGVRFSDKLASYKEDFGPSLCYETKLLNALGWFLGQRVINPNPITSLISGRFYGEHEPHESDRARLPRFGSAHLARLAIDRFWEKIGEREMSAYKAQKIMFAFLRGNWSRAEDKGDDEENDDSFPISGPMMGVINDALEDVEKEPQVQKTFVAYWDNFRQEHLLLSTTTKLSAPLKSILKIPLQGPELPPTEEPMFVPLSIGHVDRFYVRAGEVIFREDWETYHWLVEQPLLKRVVRNDSHPAESPATSTVVDSLERPESPTPSTVDSDVDPYSYDVNIAWPTSTEGVAAAAGPATPPESPFRRRTPSMEIGSHSRFDPNENPYKYGRPSRVSEEYAVLRACQDYTGGHVTDSDPDSSDEEPNVKDSGEKQNGKSPSIHRSDTVKVELNSKGPGSSPGGRYYFRTEDFSDSSDESD